MHYKANDLILLVIDFCSNNSDDHLYGFAKKAMIDLIENCSVESNKWPNSLKMKIEGIVKACDGRNFYELFFISKNIIFPFDVMLNSIETHNCNKIRLSTAEIESCLDNSVTHPLKWFIRMLLEVF